MLDHLIIYGETHHWDINFVRAIQDWELESMVTFMDLIYSSPMSRNGLDTLCWNLSSRNIFEVKSFINY